LENNDVSQLGRKQGASTIC